MGASMAGYIGGSGRLRNPVVPAYTALDARWAWRISRALEVSFTAQNLFDPGHPEFDAAATRSEFERGAFLGLRWTP